MAESSQESMNFVFIKQEILEEDEQEETMPESNVIYIKEEAHCDAEQNSVGYLKEDDDVDGRSQINMISGEMQAEINSESWIERTSLSDGALSGGRSSEESSSILPAGTVCTFPSSQIGVDTRFFPRTFDILADTNDRSRNTVGANHLLLNTALGRTSNPDFGKKLFTENKPFKCPSCEYRTSWACALKRHVATHTGLRPYKCALCPYSGTQPGHLRKHEATHTGERPYKCALCEYTSGQPGHLKRHIMATHTEVEDKPFRCHLCPFRSGLAGALRRHANTHAADKPLKCELCAYSTFQAADLRAHAANHRGEKPFRCPLCDYATAFKSNIGKHVRTHSGDKPFHCTYCDYACGDRTSLVSHMVRKHSDIRPYGCAHCSHRTVTKSDLIRHLRAKHKYCELSLL